MEMEMDRELYVRRMIAKSDMWLNDGDGHKRCCDDSDEQENVKRGLYEENPAIVYKQHACDCCSTYPTK